MKRYSSILLLLLLVMYFKPCTDSLQAQENIKLESVEKTVSHQDNGFDGCTPFCSCSCCSIRAVSRVFQQVAFISPKTVIAYSQRLPSKPVKVSISIWQPPQLG